MTGYLILVAAAGGVLFFVATIIDAYRSPEFKRDMERLREQRRARHASRRS